MSSRHTRRKQAAKRANDKLEAIATAERSRRVSKVVRANKASPIERNYYPPSPMGSLSEHAARGMVVGHGGRVVYKDRTVTKRFAQR